MNAVPHTSLHRHPYPHRELVRRYRYYIRQRDYRTAALVSFALFVASVVLSFYAIEYATERASSSVSDLILSNIPVFDVDALFALGTILLLIFIALLLLAHPKRVPFTLNSLALFYVIRSIFITLTHIGPFPVQSPSGDWGKLLTHFLFSGDLFFSGHVGLCFLMALIFWKEKALRNIFIAWSVYMSAVVLLGHLHYSIDVASAFFITYTIFCLSEWIFAKDRALFYSDMPIEA